MKLAVIMLAVIFIMGAIFFSCVKISVALHKRRAICEFRLKAYGVAMEVYNRTGCDYGELKCIMDNAIKRYDTKNEYLPHDEKSKKAFLSNQVRRFVYLCALDCALQYGENHIVSKNVEEYCVLPPPSDGLDFEWHIKHPFWSGGEDVLVGLSVASLIFIFFVEICKFFLGT